MASFHTSILEELLIHDDAVIKLGIDKNEVRKLSVGLPKKEYPKNTPQDKKDYETYDYTGKNIEDVIDTASQCMLKKQQQETHCKKGEDTDNYSVLDEALKKGYTITLLKSLDNRSFGLVMTDPEAKEDEEPFFTKQSIHISMNQLFLNAEKHLGSKLKASESSNEG